MACPRPQHSGGGQREDCLKGIVLTVSFTFLSLFPNHIHSEDAEPGRATGSRFYQTQWQRQIRSISQAARRKRSLQLPLHYWCMMPTIPTSSGRLRSRTLYLQTSHSKMHTPRLILPSKMRSHIVQDYQDTTSCMVSRMIRHRQSYRGCGIFP